MPEEWLPVALAAGRLGVSVRAIQKRCAGGSLPARRVAGARGEVWEVEADALRASANLKANTVRVRSQKPLPASNEREGRTVESEREHELKDEVRFLRGLIEQLQRDGAETRAALRKALENAPRQLEQGKAPDAPQRGKKSEEQGELDPEELLDLCRKICS